MVGHSIEKDVDGLKICRVFFVGMDPVVLDAVRKVPSWMFLYSLKYSGEAIGDVDDATHLPRGHIWRIT